MNPATRAHLYVLRAHADDAMLIAVTAAAEYIAAPDTTSYERLQTALRAYDHASDVWAIAAIQAASAS